MDSIKQPKVSVGLPVYNGEKYIRSAIESIINQSMTDFELIITDNASTDSTEVICREFAEQDSRVKYFRNDSNIGASQNHNRTLELSTGKYFVWASYDDIRHPEYLEACSSYLEEHPEVVSCHSLTKYIDADGKETSRQEVALDLSSSDPVTRFKEMIRMDHKVEIVLSMIRTEYMKKTKGLAPYSDSDRVLMSELSLYGPFHIIKEYYFYRREHPNNSFKVYTSRQSRMAWFDPRLKGKLSFPHYRQFFEYISSISRSPLPVSTKLKCVRAMLKWSYTYRTRLKDDTKFGLIYIVKRLLVALRLYKLKED